MTTVPTYGQLLAAAQLVALDEAMFCATTDEGYAACGLSDTTDFSVALLLNDTFGYATADLEVIPWEQVEALRDLYRELDTDERASKMLLHWAQFRREIPALQELREWLDHEPRLTQIELMRVQDIARVKI